MKLARLTGWPWDRNQFPKTCKADIINALAQANGYRSYLEIATLTTGGKFADVSGKIFSTRKRALYNVPDNYSDGLPVHYACPEQNSSKCLQPLLDSGQTFDIVFIDPYHSFDASKLDLEIGIKLLEPGGVLVVHDCNPPRKYMTVPEYRGGYWLGKTYLAFLEFVAQHPELDYCVIDTDWGVGLVFNPATDKPAQCDHLPGRPNFTDTSMTQWKHFAQHRRRLLRLISVQQFFDCFITQQAHGESL